MEPVKPPPFISAPQTLSAKIGKHSAYKILVEIMTQIATAKRKEVDVQLIIGLIIFQYLPTSVNRAMTTNVYPRRAVKSAGLTMSW